MATKTSERDRDPGQGAALFIGDPSADFGCALLGKGWQGREP